MDEMSSRQTPTGFNIADLYTRIVPGTVLTLSVFLPLFGTSAFENFLAGESIYQQIPNDSNLTWVLLLFVIFSLIAGEFVDLLRGSRRPVPPMFRKIIYNSTNDRYVLGLGQRLYLWIYERHIPLLNHFLLGLDTNNFNWVSTDNGEIKTTIGDSDAGFLNHFRAEMNMTPTFTNPRIIYLSLSSHMDTRMSTTTRKYKTAYESLENFRLAFFISLVPIVIHVASDEYFQQAIAVLLLLFLVMIYVYAMFLGKSSTNAEGLYIESLIIDYLIPSRGHEEGVRKGSGDPAPRGAYDGYLINDIV